MSGCLAVPAAALSVALEPIQDLHGYEYPWAEGAGKNKCNPDNLGHGVRDNATGQITSQSNTATSTTNPVAVDSSATYVVSKNGVAVATSILRVFYYDVNGDFISTEVVNPFTTPSSAKFVAFQTGYGDGNLEKWQLEKASTATAYEPYSNICPISGRTGTSVSTRNEDNTETASATISFGTTVYGGQVDFKTGIVTVEWGYIASYNGETLPSEWISDRDVYASGTTPTTGAEVAYKLATPTELTLTPAQLTMLKGYNYLSGDGTITITAYVKTT